MTDYQIRFTPHDISGYDFSWLDGYPKYAVYSEGGNGVEHHYHIWLPDIKVSEATLRNQIRKNLRVPPCGKGQANKFYALVADWKDPSYIFKSANCYKIKGITEPERMSLEIQGRSLYVDKASKDSPLTIYEVATKKAKRVNLNKEIIGELTNWYLVENKIRPVNKWQVIDKCMTLVKGHGRGINMYQIRDFCNEAMAENEDFRGKLIDKISDLMV